jgi:hypothetical protein
MKKKFILIVEFDAEIGEQLRVADKEKTKYLNVLLKELLKHDRAILDIYKLWLMADFVDGNQLFEMDAGIVKKTNEIELIRPVLERLSQEAREHFAKVLKMDRDRINSYFESLFALFGILNVGKVNFIEKGKQTKTNNKKILYLKT